MILNNRSYRNHYLKLFQGQQGHLKQQQKYLLLSYLADVDDVDDVEEPVSFELNAPDDKESDCVFKPRQSTSICSVYAPFVPFTLFVLTG